MQKYTSVKIKDKILAVNGLEFVVKGVCYSPIKAGYSWTNYDWWSDPETYNTDFPLIKAMGANCIRVYAPSSNETSVRSVLDAACANGLHVILEFGVPWDRDFTNAADRQPIIDDFMRFVSKWKDHPAILMWNFGNEVDVHTKNPVGWYILLDKAAAAAHSVEGPRNHPVTSAIVGYKEIMTYDPVLQNLDVWGVNLFTGKTFGNAFLSYNSAKPLLITEYGCDSYNAKAGKPDQQMQSDYIKEQWNDIEKHLSVRKSAESCIGGCLFEWCDEWWKGTTTPKYDKAIGTGGVKGVRIQDTEPDWSNPAYEDQYMNEEWWGLVSVELDSYVRKPKKVYHMLSKLWTQYDSGAQPPRIIESGMIRSEIDTCPNPFLNDGYNAARIRFSVVGSPELRLEIQDITGMLVREISEIAGSGQQKEAYWSGRDSSSNLVAEGEYICKVCANYFGKEEVKLARITVVR